jgi:hypothetical protein
MSSNKGRPASNISFEEHLVGHYQSHPRPRSHGLVRVATYSTIYIPHTKLQHITVWCYTVRMGDGVAFQVFRRFTFWRSWRQKSTPRVGATGLGPAAAAVREPPGIAGAAVIILGRQRVPTRPSSSPTVEKSSSRLDESRKDRRGEMKRTFFFFGVANWFSTSSQKANLWLEYISANV